MTREVTFDLVKGPVNDQIDDAYREKYRGSPYLDPMISERAVDGGSDPEEVVGARWLTALWWSPAATNAMSSGVSPFGARERAWRPRPASSPGGRRR